jgi:hypothetical protein
MGLVDGAERAYPVGGEVFELGARSNAVVGVTLCGVILVPADVANILFHIIVILGFIFRSAKIQLFSKTAKKYFIPPT